MAMPGKCVFIIIECACVYYESTGMVIPGECVSIIIVCACVYAMRVQAWPCQANVYLLLSYVYTI